MIKDLLKTLNWSAYQFWKESGIKRSTAFKLVAGEREGSSLEILAVKWLKSLVK